MAKAGRQFHFSRKSSLSTVAIALLITSLSVSLILLVFGIVSLPSSRKSHLGHDISSIHHTSVHRINEERSDKWVEFVSWEPRAFVYHNFLSKEECEYLIDVAKPHMKKSMVVDIDTGKGVESKIRTSSGAFLTTGQDKIIRNIEQRIADWTFIPVDHGESLHVIHYKVGEKYEPHFDYFTDEHNTKNGDQRLATILMYLSDVEEGGETVFPDAKGNHSAVPYWDNLSECGRGGLSLKPKMGDALLFWNMNPDATVDPLSLHGSCPVIRGDKWACTKWLHVYKYAD